MSEFSLEELPPYPFRWESDDVPARYKGPVDPERTKRIILRRLYGESLASIATSLNVRPQTLVSLFKAHAPELLIGLNSRTNGHIPPDRKQAALIALQWRFINAIPCYVCGFWVLRENTCITCSPECRVIYHVIYPRLHPDGEAIVRRRRAAWGLKNRPDSPDTRRRVELAEGKGKPIIHRTHPGSKSRRIQKELGLIKKKKRTRYLGP